MANIPENSNYTCPVAPLFGRRYRILQEVEAVGSVAEVCRHAGITRQTYYLWKRRYVTSGLLGLEDRPRPPSPGRPRRITSGLAQILLEHVKKRPKEGCAPLSKRLAATGIGISSPTIQKALIGWGLGSQKSRTAWVAAGSPPLETFLAEPIDGIPSRGTLECAKAYFFYGIPQGAGRPTEVLKPSVEEVANAIGVSFPRLQEVARDECWRDARDRFLARLELIEFQEGMEQARARADSTVVTGAALSLRNIRKALGASPGPSPRELSRLIRALEQSYKTLKLAFGGSFPALSGREYSRGGRHLDDLPGQPVRRKRESREMPDHMEELARRLFFLGIPPFGQESLKFRPSVREVAQHLGLPLRPLQKLALRGDWVTARKEADKLNENHRANRLLHWFGYTTIQTLIIRFSETADISMQALCKTLDEVDLSVTDLCKLTKYLNKPLNLCRDIILNISVMHGVVANSVIAHMNNNNKNEFVLKSISKINNNSTLQSTKKEMVGTKSHGDQYGVSAPSEHEAQAGTPGTVGCKGPAVSWWSRIIGGAR